MIPVLLSGGSGTRLWPVSRVKMPKQFCNLLGEPLQTQTLKRVAHWGAPWIVTSATLKVLTEKNLRDSGLKAERVLYEPVARNTTAAIALLCRVLQLSGRDQEIVGVFPSDHLIRDEAAFQKAVQTATAQAEKNRIVTLGLRPDHPETGYGYIQTKPEASDAGAFQVERFHEKPDLAKAQSFLKEGNFSWNAGIFIFRISHMISLMKKHAPDVWAPFEDLKADLSNLSEIYPRVKSISIDFAVMEKIGGTADLVCVPVDMGWSDVGSWDAVANERQNQGTSAVGVQLQTDDSSNVFVQGPVGKKVALIGVHDLNIIDTGDALLVTGKGRSQDVRTVVDRWAKEKDPITTEHASDERPWGRYEILRDTERFKSKVIVVDAGQQLSYQSHAKREEHWIITAGKGEVVLDDAVHPVKAGTHIHIPLGAKHRMRNTGSQPLEFVEVQLGTYFGEDDIVRYADDYSRA